MLLDSPLQVVLNSAIWFRSEMHSEIQNTKAITLVFSSIFDRAYFRLLRADLSRKISPLDSPLQVVLNSAILFRSEMHSEIQNTKAIALVFSSIFDHSKGGLFSAPAIRSEQGSITTRFTSPSSTK